jgi:hypothetical protein
MPGSALRSREKARVAAWEMPTVLWALITTLVIGGAGMFTDNGLLVSGAAALITVALFAYLTVGHLRTRGLRDREMLALPWIVLSGPRQRKRLSLTLADRQKPGPRAAEP